MLSISIVKIPNLNFLFYKIPEIFINCVQVCVECNLFWKGKSHYCWYCSPCQSPCVFFQSVSLPLLPMVDPGLLKICFYAHLKQLHSWMQTSSFNKYFQEAHALPVTLLAFPFGAFAWEKRRFPGAQSRTWLPMTPLLLGCSVASVWRNSQQWYNIGGGFVWRRPTSGKLNLLWTQNANELGSG